MSARPEMCSGIFAWLPAVVQCHHSTSNHVCLIRDVLRRGWSCGRKTFDSSVHVGHTSVKAYDTGKSRGAYDSSGLKSTNLISHRSKRKQGGQILSGGHRRSMKMSGCFQRAQPLQDGTTVSAQHSKSMSMTWSPQKGISTSEWHDCVHLMQALLLPAHEIAVHSDASWDLTLLQRRKHGPCQCSKQARQNVFELCTHTQKHACTQPKSSCSQAH